MRKLLITGGFGKIGRHFIQHFHDQYSIRVADIVTEVGLFPNSVEVFQADLTDFANCPPLCEGIDTIIHLAGIIDEGPEADEMMETNTQTILNIFKAATRSGCKRVIFASSAQTIEGYSKDVQVNINMPVRPGNLYGVSKCFGEALSAYHAYHSNISAICLRIGAFEFPEDYTEMNARDLSAFTHPDDLNQLLQKSIEAQNIQYEVLNAISNNRYKRLDISEAKERVGYEPQADAFELFNLKKGP